MLDVVLLTGRGWGCCLRVMRVLVTAQCMQHLLEQEEGEELQVCLGVVVLHMQPEQLDGNGWLSSHWFPLLHPHSLCHKVAGGPCAGEEGWSGRRLVEVKKVSKVQ